MEAVRLDDYFAEREGDGERRVDLIKMDVQGAEGRALAGMGALLRQNGQASIITEFWPQRLAECGVEVGAEAFLALLAGHGFALHNISEEKGRVEAISATALLDAYGDDPIGQTNLLCKRAHIE